MNLKKAKTDLENQTFQAFHKLTKETFKTRNNQPQETKKNNYLFARAHSFLHSTCRTAIGTARAQSQKSFTCTEYKLGYQLFLT
jgi:hypothetical protein